MSWNVIYTNHHDDDGNTVTLQTKELFGSSIQFLKECDNCNLHEAPPAFVVKVIDELLNACELATGPLQMPPEAPDDDASTKRPAAGVVELPLVVSYGELRKFNPNLPEVDQTVQGIGGRCRKQVWAASQLALISLVEAADKAATGNSLLCWKYVSSPSCKTVSHSGEPLPSRDFYGHCSAEGCRFGVKYTMLVPWGAGYKDSDAYFKRVNISRDGHPLEDVHTCDPKDRRTRLRRQDKEWISNLRAKGNSLRSVVDQATSRGLKVTPQVVSNIARYNNQLATKAEANTVEQWLTSLARLGCYARIELEQPCTGNAEKNSSSMPRNKVTNLFVMPTHTGYIWKCKRFGVSSVDYTQIIGREFVYGSLVATLPNCVSTRHCSLVTGGHCFSRGETSAAVRFFNASLKSALSALNLLEPDGDLPIWATYRDGSRALNSFFTAPAHAKKDVTLRVIVRVLTSESGIEFPYRFCEHYHNGAHFWCQAPTHFRRVLVSMLKKSTLEPEAQAGVLSVFICLIFALNDIDDIACVELIYLDMMKTYVDSAFTFPEHLGQSSQEQRSHGGMDRPGRNQISDEAWKILEVIAKSMLTNDDWNTREFDDSSENSSEVYLNGCSIRQTLVWLYECRHMYMRCFTALAFIRALFAVSHADSWFSKVKRDLEFPNSATAVNLLRLLRIVLRLSAADCKKVCTNQPRPQKSRCPSTPRLLDRALDRFVHEWAVRGYMRNLKASKAYSIVKWDTTGGGYDIVPSNLVSEAIKTAAKELTRAWGLTFDEKHIIFCRCSRKTSTADKSDDEPESEDEQVDEAFQQVLQDPDVFRNPSRGRILTLYNKPKGERLPVFISALISPKHVELLEKSDAQFILACSCLDTRSHGFPCVHCLCAWSFTTSLHSSSIYEIPFPLWLFHSSFIKGKEDRSHGAAAAVADDCVGPNTCPILSRLKLGQIFWRLKDGLRTDEKATVEDIRTQEITISIDSVRSTVCDIEFVLNFTADRCKEAVDYLFPSIFYGRIAPADAVKHVEALVSAVNHNHTTSLAAALFPFSLELIKQKMMFVAGPNALGSMSGQPNIRPTSLQDALNSILQYQNASVQNVNFQGRPSLEFLSEISKLFSLNIRIFHSGKNKSGEFWHEIVHQDRRRKERINLCFVTNSLWLCLAQNLIDSPHSTTPNNVRFISRKGQMRKRLHVACKKATNKERESEDRDEECSNQSSEADSESPTTSAQARGRSSRKPHGAKRHRSIRAMGPKEKSGPNQAASGTSDSHQQEPDDHDGAAFGSIGTGVETVQSSSFSAGVVHPASSSAAGGGLLGALGSPSAIVGGPNLNDIAVRGSVAPLSGVISALPPALGYMCAGTHNGGLLSSTSLLPNAGIAPAGWGGGGMLNSVGFPSAAPFGRSLVPLSSGMSFGGAGGTSLG